MFLNKTEVLNGALENIPSSYAYDLWNRMGNNCDGYSLNFMLQRLKILSKPKESSTLLWKGWSSKKKKTRPN